MQLDLIISATVTPAVILVGVMFTLVLLIVYFIVKKSSRTKNEPDQWYTSLTRVCNIHNSSVDSVFHE